MRGIIKRYFSSYYSQEVLLILATFFVVVFHSKQTLLSQDIFSRDRRRRKSFALFINQLFIEVYALFTALKEKKYGVSLFFISFSYLFIFLFLILFLLIICCRHKIMEI